MQVCTRLDLLRAQIHVCYLGLGLIDFSMPTTSYAYPVDAYWRGSVGTSDACGGGVAGGAWLRFSCFESLVKCSAHHGIFFSRSRVYEILAKMLYVSIRIIERCDRPALPLFTFTPFSLCFRRSLLGKGTRRKSQSIYPRYWKTFSCVIETITMHWLPVPVPHFPFCYLVIIAPLKSASGAKRSFTRNTFV